jgi:thiol-disulfide isomerase/thioredoxin
MKIAIAVLAAFLAAFLLTRPKPVDHRAPAFKLADTAGRLVRLSDYKGKVVVLNFWATWCPECEKELPLLEQAHRKHPEVAFLAASIDENGRKAVLPYLAQHPITMTVLLADPNSTKDYGVWSIPATYLITRSGEIAKRYVGPIDPLVLENDIVSALGGTQ